MTLRDAPTGAVLERTGPNGRKKTIVVVSHYTTPTCSAGRRPDPPALRLRNGPHARAERPPPRRPPTTGSGRHRATDRQQAGIAVPRRRRSQTSQTPERNRNVQQRRRRAAGRAECFARLVLAGQEDAHGRSLLDNAERLTDRLPMYWEKEIGWLAASLEADRVDEATLLGIGSTSSRCATPAS